MQEIKETCYKGTRILLGNEKRKVIEDITKGLIVNGYTEISIPVIQLQSTFTGKVGEENNNLMFNFRDRGDREVCLAPEYTAVVQKLAASTFKDKKDIRLFYVQECFRGEKPQAGRYRQFTQLGVEILNPTKDYIDELIERAMRMLAEFGLYDKDVIVNKDVVRGLDYYVGGRGFEIACDKYGSARQICGGGEYNGGVGFAIGVDRLLSFKI